MSRPVKRKRKRLKKPPPEWDPKIWKLKPAVEPKRRVGNPGIPVPKFQYRADLLQILEWWRQQRPRGLRFSLRSKCYGICSETHRDTATDGVEWFNPVTGKRHKIPDPDSLRNQITKAEKLVAGVVSYSRNELALGEENVKAQTPAPRQQNQAGDVTTIQLSKITSTTSIGQPGPVVSTGFFNLSKIFLITPSWGRITGKSPWRLRVGKKWYE
jgi:hypothetical protein